MKIPQEIIEARLFIADSAAAPELLFSIESYNDKMRASRRKVRDMWRWDKVFLALNIAVIIALGMIPKGSVFLFRPRVVWLEWAALGVFAAAFLYFGFWKRKFVVLAAFSALLLLTDARLAILPVINAAFAAVRVKMLADIKKREGYPDFAPIRIEKAGKAAEKEPPDNENSADDTLGEEKRI